MAVLTAEVLIQQATEGRKLDADQRRRCIAHMMTTQRQMSNVELGDLFQVSEKTIREDKQKIRETVAQEMETDDISLVIADLKMSFTQQLCDLEAGKRKSELGTKNHLDYCKAIIDLEIRRTELFQKLGILPSNIGVLNVNEYNFQATVVKGDRVETKRFEEFDKTTQEKILDRRKKLEAVAAEQIIDVTPAERLKAVIPISAKPESKS